MTDELRAFGEDIKRHFDVTAETLRSDIRAVAEGVLSARQGLDEFRKETAAGFAETQAMIKFSHDAVAQV